MRDSPPNARRSQSVVRNGAMLVAEEDRLSAGYICWTEVNHRPQAETCFDQPPFDSPQFNACHVGVVSSQSRDGKRAVTSQ